MALTVTISTKPILAGDIAYVWPAVGFIASLRKDTKKDSDVISWLRVGCPVLVLDAGITWHPFSSGPTWAKVLSHAGVGFIFLSCLIDQEPHADG